MSSVLAFLLLVAGAFAADNATTSKVSVVVYYEALCPDSAAFINKQLYPTWEKMMDHINLTLVPYGKATMEKINETTTFTCHHGPEECFGNKVQACILEGNLIPTLADKVKVINCLMAEGKKGTDYLTTLKKCVGEIPTLEPTVTDSLEKCANSTEGDNFLSQYGEKTKAFEAPLANVPAVTINNMKDTGAISKFQDALCGKIATNKPAECKGSGAASLAALTLLPIITSFALLKL